MAAEDIHQRALQLFRAGQAQAAWRLLSQALGAEETPERWNDWATAQLACQRAEEAEQGYRCALAIDPHYLPAAMNLGVLLAGAGRPAEALPLLQLALPAADAAEQETLRRLLDECQRHGAALQEADDAAWEDCLRSFCGASENERSYFQTHLARYLATLRLLPPASPGQRLLELGAAFHHLTPALRLLKGYQDIRCTDIWQGASQIQRQVRSADGSHCFQFPVDNFDVESAPWPYPDAFFDVVLCCELLEHLSRDPMLVLSEINRVLAAGGLLLLTTPNIASAKSAAYVLRGDSPYIYGQYEPNGRPTDRHNREYTAGEVQRLVAAAGFRILRLFTQNSWWEPERETLRWLAASGFPIARRGDNTFLLARRETAPRERFPEELYLRKGTQAERRDTQDAPDRRDAAPLHFLVVHDVLPHADRSGSDARLMQVLRALRAAGHSVTYLARNGANEERYRPALDALGIPVYAGDAERLRYAGIEAPARWALEEVLRRQQVDCAILFHWFWSGISVAEQYPEAIRRCSPQTLVAVLTDDFHGLRERRAAQLSGLLSDEERAADYQQRELEIYRQADLILAISPEDRRKMLAEVPELEIELLPMAADIAPAGPGFEDRAGLFFAGNFDNAANQEGMQWFLEQVWPRVRKELPGAALHVAGNNIPAALASAGAGIVSLGHLPSLEPALQRHRVFISPVRFGTGIKTKNLAALAAGIPLVTTTVGAEGMNLRHGEEALLADTPEEFAAAVVRAYQDRALWESLARRGQDHVRNEFSWERLHEQVGMLAARVRRFQPPGKPAPLPSIRRVEALHPEVLTHQPAAERMQLRLLAWVRMAEELLLEGRPAAAGEQLRHIFAFVRGAIPRNMFFARVLEALERCYAELGQPEKAARCRQEAQRCRGASPAPLPKAPEPGAPSSPKKRGRRRNWPELSVVIPTYNRRDTLGSCLLALSGQSLPPEQFEVIVVDDGSTDGTPAFCAELQVPYRLEYLRQANAGAGAARRAGTERSRGKVVLYFNDDTIAEPELLAEHLRVHQQHPREKWAVLGDFRYPADASRRALAHFLNTHPFLFPQRGMEPGKDYGHAHFVTCNLSLRREAVMEVGSFDPQFRLAEDTELGVRLE
ncbi:MAG TPA: glycosyltransferase, partial [Terriglobia bacterium]|nr:glycosyltransferase [Terriglobia bacterium]